MARINLLPWREERRQQRKQEFLVVLGGMALIGAGLVLLAKMYFDGQISYQQSRNDYLKKHIAELNKQVKEIKEIDRKKRDLIERMDVIQGLQGKRPIIVRVFDEIVRTLPDGVYYQKLSSKDKQISLVGTAESNNRISSLMRRVDQSDWFASPNLSAVRAKPEFGEQASSFDLSFVIATPATKKEQDK